MGEGGREGGEGGRRVRRGREGGREKGEGGRAGERGGGGREGREGGRERERERKRERERGGRRGCPRQQRDSFLEKKSSDSYLDTLKSLDFYMRKEKLRLIPGHFEKFGLISDKKKVRTHIWYI